MNRITSLLMLALMLFTTSCATVFARENGVNVTSRPSGKTVKVTDENGLHVKTGRTPFTMELQPSDGYFDRMSYTFESGNQAIVKSPGVNWVTGINLLFFPVLGGLVIDPLSGQTFHWSDVDLDYSK